MSPLKVFVCLLTVFAVGKTSTIPANPVEVANAEVEEDGEEDGKIVGGQDTEIEMYPYLASLQFLGSHICGASIISSKFAVTAAHCTFFFKGLKIRYGSSKTTEGGVLSNILCSKEHPKYLPPGNDYDVSVVQVWGNFFSDPIAKPIPICGFDQIAAGSMSTISGWGVTLENGSTPDVLQVAHVPVISKEECQAQYGVDTITARMLCAGVPEGGVDSCQGDSGGPLVVASQLCGVVSWGEGCAKPNKAGVYSNLANVEMKAFITKATSAMIFCLGV